MKILLYSFEGTYLEIEGSLQETRMTRNVQIRGATEKCEGGVMRITLTEYFERAK